MILSDRDKKISISISIIIFLAFLVGSFNSILVLWKSVYTDEGQSISSYNSIELDILSTIENSYKSILPLEKTNIEKIFLYISEKKQNQLLSDLPYSSKKWVKGLILDNYKLEKISVRHRGDNPNNWLHTKKSWRVKRKKNNLKDGTRVFDYLLPRDTALINTYLGYFIANKMNIPAPSYKFVELYINDAYEGLYLEIERLDENFLRKSNIMPVNIYKGTPSRTDKPMNQDADLFNNPFLWEKRSVFNARPPTNYEDLESFLISIRSAVNDDKKMNSLEKKADIKKWANFSAYETIMQSWHNYEKNNMYLISDPWIDEIYPIAFDTIFNDTKSILMVEEPINMDNASQALTEIYSNNSKFMFEKYKILNRLIKNNLYEDIKNEVNRIYSLIKTSWKNDPSHTQFVLSNEFERKLFFTKGMDQEIKILIDRISFIENNLKKNFNAKGVHSWNQKNNQLELVINSLRPITKIKICLESALKEEKLNFISDEGNNFQGIEGDDGCYFFDIILNSNRVKPQYDLSRITTFSASSGFEVKSTAFTFRVNKDTKIKKILVRLLGDDEYLSVSKNKKLSKNSRTIHNKPIKLVKSEEELVWQGDVFIDESLVINKPIKILPGTTVFLSKNASIIFKNQVNSIGAIENNINFIKYNDEPWGVVALIGKKTEGSRFKFTNFSGGSGGNFDGYEFTGMFSIYSSKNIELSNLNFSNNFIYDDLIHILYSSNIKLKDSVIFDGRSDLIDIDISSMEISNCIFKNSGNDAIDSMSSNVKILDTYIDLAGDKGLSAGESSIVSVINVTFDNTEIAIQSKDGTHVSVKESNFLDNKLQLDAYQKNWRYGSGGEIEVTGSFFKGRKNLIKAKNKSKILISESFFNKNFTNSETQKINLINNSLIN